MANRDTWDKAEIVAKVLGAILLPIVLLLVGNWYKSRDEASARERAALESNANRVTGLMKGLCSESSRERALAAAVAQYFAEHNQLPPEIWPVLQRISETDSSAEVSKAAGGALHEASKSPELAEKIDAAAKSAPSRIYIQIYSEAQRAGAKAIATALAAKEWSVPGIERVETPLSITDVRYYHAADKTWASNVVEVLKANGISNVSLHTMVRDTNRVPLRQCEIWFGANDLMK